jgi:hypothetical protein
MSSKIKSTRLRVYHLNEKTEAGGSSISKRVTIALKNA